MKQIDPVFPEEIIGLVSAEDERLYEPTRVDAGPRHR